jgi:Ribosomally synthesized peptide prototyped by Frankia Franean1_4349.
MSLENVQTIIGRAIIEPEYRDLLFNDPAKAMEGYDLTKEELQALESIEKEKLNTLANDLEERVSKAGLFLTGKYSDASLALNLSNLFKIR